jgi:hypothetical protein
MFDIFYAHTRRRDDFGRHCQLGDAAPAMAASIDAGGVDDFGGSDEAEVSAAAL